MNKEEIEFIEGYENLLDKGYCDCNEMNCLGYNSPKEILRIVKKLQQENKQLREKVKYLKEQKENKNKWCQLIADIGYDYDGFNTEDSLKGLIDELVQYSLYARDNYSYEDFVLKGGSDE